MTSQTNTNVKNYIADPYFEIARNLTLKELVGLMPVVQNLHLEVSLKDFIIYQPNEERFERLKEMVTIAPYDLFKTIFDTTDLSISQKTQLLNLAVKGGKVPQNLAYLLTRTPLVSIHPQQLLTAAVKAGNASSVTCLLATLPENSTPPLLIGQLFFLAASIRQCRVAEAIQDSPAFERAKTFMLQA